ncbi:hypothetical protein JNB88_27415 [Rhizobium cauense]|uniref:hypothetical protein n=1 Tax=Rhizobium cauense TaxID=1166683 RepID=UPI001C6ECB3B|nr:hypothetical protein [Rhizobium cauense]MBW9117353.1 hypothetical protein [Rhizobium cauense]
MSKEKHENQLHAPAIIRKKSAPKTLDLEQIDLNRNGVQEDVMVSKGRARTVVTTLPDSEDDK